MTLQPHFIVLFGCVVVSTVAAVWLRRAYKARMARHGSWYDDFLGLAVLGWLVMVLAALFLLTLLAAMIPFNARYWTYEHVSGTVQSVSNRFQSGTGDLSGEDYVLRLRGQRGVLNLQDDRIQGVKAGDPVDLTCTVQWVYAGQDQTNCFIRSWR